GARRSSASNPVRFEVRAAPVASPPASRVYRRGGESGTELVYRQPGCGTVPGPIGRASLTASAPDASAGSTATIATARVIQTDQLRGGEPLFFEITAAAANRNPAAIDQLRLRITTREGDVETITVFETAPDSGVFAGVIETRRIPPPVAVEDCRLSVGADSRITLTAMSPDSETAMVSAEVKVLVDPFGVVFDSETGALIDGARVTLVDAASGAPATVFAP
ncbi:MAG: hypothetical protein ACK4MR_00610, partial [Erythrobacter cryptus]